LNYPPTDKIRNVAIVGHSGCGKTTLAEALLMRAGILARAGRVEDGTTVCDTEPEEAKRGMSLSLAIAPLDWKASDGETYKVNLIDTPGYTDFAADVDAALSVADLAVLVVSAVDGVEVGTELAWKKCAERGIPRLVFVNKEDKPRADFHKVLDNLKSSFGSGFVTLELPLGEEEKFHGIADVLTDQGFEYEPDGSHHAEAIPADVADEEHRLHEEIVEEIVAGDDEQLERYLGGDVPTSAELERTLAHEVLECVEFPVLVGSAATGVGIDRLADFICELGPSPDLRPTTVTAGSGPAATDVDVTADPSGKPLAYVFKTVADQFVGQVSLFKVLSGTVAVDDRLVNTATGTEERLHGVFHIRGREHLPTNKVVAGDLAAVAKLASTPTGSTLAPKDSPVRVAARTSPPPSFGLALKPVTQSDDDKLSGALQRLISEDPALLVERNEETGQTVLRGAGDTHLAVALERLARKFGVNVETEDVRVPYRETITGSAEAEGKIKKQSGGHGQFADCRIRVEPLPRGADFEFVDDIYGGSIPRNFIPAVEKGIQEVRKKGYLAGYPMVDFRVILYDGQYHDVDSSELAFKIAGALAFKEAMEKARPTLLEPVMHVEVTAPNEYVGDLMGDLSSRRGQVQGMEAGEDDTIIKAQVPMAELLTYGAQLRSITQGRGSFHLEFSHYSEVPQGIQEKLVAHARAQKEAAQQA
jgi:elongation factor G